MSAIIIPTYLSTYLSHKYMRMKLSKKNIESLSYRVEPYYFKIAKGVSIGVRIFKDGGYSWIIRIYSPKGYSLESFPSTFTVEQIKSKALNRKGGFLTFAEAKVLYLSERKGKIKAWNELNLRLQTEHYSSLDPILIADLDRKLLDNWISSFPSSLSPGTVNKHISILRAVLNYCYSIDELENDKAFRHIKMLKYQKKEITIVTPEEESKLLSVCDPSFGKLVRWGLDTGMRLSELINLTWDKVYQSKSGHRVRLIDTKSGKDRIVPVRLPITKEHPVYVFVNTDGNKYKIGRQTKLMTYNCRKAGLRHIRFHDLRHTFATRALMSGVPVQVVSHILGHTTTAMTEKNYRHLLTSWVLDSYEAYSLR